MREILAAINGTKPRALAFELCSSASGSTSERWYRHRGLEPRLMGESATLGGGSRCRFVGI